jgi:hypothetical protein
VTSDQFISGSWDATIILWLLPRVARARNDDHDPRDDDSGKEDDDDGSKKSNGADSGQKDNDDGSKGSNGNDNQLMMLFEMQ